VEVRELVRASVDTSISICRQP